MWTMDYLDIQVTVKAKDSYAEGADRQHHTNIIVLIERTGKCATLYRWRARRKKD